VGGGYGALLAAILQKNPTQKGILFDQPHVVVDSEPYLIAAGVADRCRCIGVDFFAAVPSGGDASVLGQILHDWDDDRCVTILDRVRRVVPKHGKLLIVELVLPPGDEPFLASGWTCTCSRSSMRASGRQRNTRRSYVMRDSR